MSGNMNNMINRRNNKSVSNVRLHPWRDGIDHCLRLLEGPQSPTPTQSQQAQRQQNSSSKRVVPIVTSIRNGVYTHFSPSNEQIRSVDVSFHDSDDQPGISLQMDVSSLFQAIGTLPNLESLIVRVTRTTPVTTMPLTRQGIVPIVALSAVLNGGSEISPTTTTTTTNTTTTASNSMDEQEDLSRNPLMGSNMRKIQQEQDNESRLLYLTLIGLPLFGDDYDINGLIELLRIHPSLQSIIFKRLCIGKRISPSTIATRTINL